VRSATVYLTDILEAIAAIERFVEGMDFEAFREDDRTSSAVIRKFEVIGEAAKQVPGSIKEKHPAVPWKRMAGMRDQLIHSYFGVKNELVWETIRRELPQLRASIRLVLEETQGREGAGR
jgi:uncharacterized protein with HEPN domain